MSEVTLAPEQDAIAESLLGDQPEETVEETTSTEEVTEPVETETQEGAAEETETTEEPTTEEIADDWLPTEQEKVFTDDTLTKYGNSRYPELVKLLNDANIAEPTRVQVRQILHDKINSDIYFQQLKQQQTTQEQEEEEPEVTEPTREPTQPINANERLAQIRTMVQQRTDPAIAKDFFVQFNKAFGVSDKDIQAALKANPNGPTEFTATLSTYALNLINTFAHDMFWSQLGPMVEQVFPNFGQMYERASHANAWDSIRNSAQQFSDLPSFGSKEFSQAARKAAEEQFGSAEDFENAVFTKTVNGQRVPLSQQENVQKKYGLLAKAMLGQRVDPAVVAQAVKTGQTQARRQAVKKDTANLGANPQRTRTEATQEPGPNDDIFAEGMQIYRQQHGRL